MQLLTEHSSIFYTFHKRSLSVAKYFRFNNFLHKRPPLSSQFFTSFITDYWCMYSGSPHDAVSICLVVYKWSQSDNSIVTLQVSEINKSLTRLEQGVFCDNNNYWVQIILTDLNQKAVSTHSSLTGLISHSMPGDDHQFLQQDQPRPHYGYSSLPTLSMPPHGGGPRYPLPPPHHHHMMGAPPPPGYAMMGRFLIICHLFLLNTTASLRTCVTLYYILLLWLK